MRARTRAYWSQNLKPVGHQLALEAQAPPHA